MNEWTLSTLAEVCEKITDGSHQSPQSTDRGKPMASVKDLTPHGITIQTCRLISEDDFSNLKRQGCSPKIGDVLIAKDGNSALDTVCVFDSDVDIVLLSSVAILRPKHTTDPYFLRYYLDTPSVRDLLKGGYLSGSAIPRVILRDFKLAPILIPEKNEQVAIGQILKKFDDKIELNQKTNQTLEDIAKAIFKSWFVDFDPVRAKAEGRPTGLSPEISDLFPDELVDSEIGEIPKGWEVTYVGEVTSNERLKVKKFTGEVKVLSAVSSGELRLSEEYFTKQVFSKNIDNYYVVPRFSFAYNPSRINIGSIGLNLFDFSGAVSPVYSVFTAREERHWFFQEWLNLHSTKGLIASLCSGSVRQSLKHADMESISLVVPPLNVNTTFNEIYELFMESIRVRNQETQILSELRDTLLPKLISGELRIPDAEKFLAEAGI